MSKLEVIQHIGSFVALWVVYFLHYYGHFGFESAVLIMMILVWVEVADE
jgi:hypothetical protein